MKQILATLLLLIFSGVCHGEQYRALITKQSPLVYWNFTHPDDAGTLQITPIHRNSPPPLRGIEGLAGVFSRSSLDGHLLGELKDDKEAKVSDTLNRSFAIEMWLLDTASAPDGAINYSLLYKADAKIFPNNSMWLYRKRQDGQFMFTIQGHDQQTIRVAIENPNLSTPTNQRAFHHLVINIDRQSDGEKGLATAYLDGQIVSRSEFNPNIKFQNSGDLIVGNNHHLNSPWEGRLDEIVIYNKPLDSDEVEKHFNAGKTTSLPDLPKSRSPEEKELFFESKIRPILVERCADCHSGQEESESSLSVHSREALLVGGKYGPALVPHRAEDSLLIAAIQKTHKELRMPPDNGDQLTRDEIQLFYQWINDGAVWPGSSQVATADIPADKATAVIFDPNIDWAFVPRKVVSPPIAKEQKWNQNPIDQFIQSQRTAHGLPANPRADRRTLIRRATFGLTGLPPTIDEVSGFLNDPADDQTAYTKVIDRLLDSTRYGERQGRLWLDVARYADTQGDVGDIPIHSAYLYRNWVINSLNKDIPFNTFLKAQLAGDMLALDSSDIEEAKGYNVATGFISLSRRFGNRKADSLHMTIEDTLDTIGRGVMGITLRCARCHDHKFDPIPTSDYYGMYGIFRSTEYPWMGMSDEKSPHNLNPRDLLNSSAAKASEYWNLISRYEYQINNHFRPWLKPTLDNFKAVESKLKSQLTQLESLQSENKGDTPEATTLRDSIAKLKEARQQHLEFKSGRFRELMLHGLNWLRSEKDRLGENPPYEFVFSVREGQGADSPVHLRGNPENPGEVVPRHFLSTITPSADTKITNGSGRLQLANWITRDDHPLTPRVITNRIWAQHFGRGIVPTLDNFGRQGERPTHPELLDWLTDSFVKNGWSLKKLHRQIMLSQTYQLSSLDPSEDNQSKDPNNLYLWKHSRQRLDAEAIRDSILFASGQLNLAQPGAHPLAPWYKTRYNLNNPFHHEYAHNHRSVYLITQRIFRHSLLGLFDSPDTNSSTSERTSTNVPAQALFLMNSKFISDHSHALAIQMTAAGNSEDARLRWLFQHVYSREITEIELTDIQRFLASYRETADTQPTSSAVVSPAYQALCRVILTSNEFFYID